MRALPTFLLALLLLGFIFASVADRADAASKPIPKKAEETEYPTLELLVSVVLIFIVAVSFEMLRRHRSKG